MADNELEEILHRFEAAFPKDKMTKALLRDKIYALIERLGDDCTFWDNHTAYEKYFALHDTADDVTEEQKSKKRANIPRKAMKDKDSIVTDSAIDLKTVNHEDKKEDNQSKGVTLPLNRSMLDGLNAIVETGSGILAQDSLTNKSNFKIESAAAVPAPEYTAQETITAIETEHESDIPNKLKRGIDLPLIMKKNGECAVECAKKPKLEPVVDEKMRKKYKSTMNFTNVTYELNNFDALKNAYLKNFKDKEVEYRTLDEQLDTLMALQDNITIDDCIQVYFKQKQLLNNIGTLCRFLETCWLLHEVISTKMEINTSKKLQNLFQIGKVDKKLNLRNILIDKCKSDFGHEYMEIYDRAVSCLALSFVFTPKIFQLMQFSDEFTAHSVARLSISKLLDAAAKLRKCEFSTKGCKFTIILSKIAQEQFFTLRHIMFPSH
jgi:hypothetical protein